MSSARDQIAVGSPNQNIKRYPIYEQSLNFFKDTAASVLSNYGEPQINTVIMNNTWSQRRITEVFGNLKYPYIAINASDIMQNPESYNLNLSAGKFIPVKSGNQVIRLRLLPVRTNLRIAFVCQDSADMYKFMHAWLFRFRSFRFVMQADNLQIGIRVRTDPNFTFPEQQSEDTGQLFRADVGAFMDSYIGESEEVIKLSEISQNVIINNNEGKQVDQENFFTFKESVNP